METQTQGTDSWTRGGKEREKNRRKKLGEWEKGKTKEMLRSVVPCSSAPVWK